MEDLKLSRRELLKLLGAGASSAFLAGCAPQATQAPEVTQEAPATTKPTKLVAMFPSEAQEFNEHYDLVCEQFKERTGIEVEYSVLPFEKLMDKELTLVAAESPDVDIFGTHYAQIGRFVEAFEPLNDYAERDGVVAEDYVKGSFDAFSYKGNLLAIPYVFDVRGFYYRTDLFEEAGIASPPTTWEELLSIAQELNNPPDVYGYAITGKGDPALREYSDLLWENGGDFLADGLNPSPPTWNEPAGVEALEWWYDLIHTHQVVPEGTPSYGWEELQGQWVSGQASMCKNWSINPSLDPDQSKVMDKFAITSLPMNKDQGAMTTAVCHGRAINRYSEHKDEAWEFIKFMTSMESMLEVYEKVGRMPAHVGALEQAAGGAEGVRKQAIEAAMTGAKYGYTWPLFPEFAEIQPILWTEIEKVLSGQKSPKEGLDYAAQEAEKIMSEAGLI